MLLSTSLAVVSALLCIYVLYSAALSSLSCLPLRRADRAQTANPFDGVHYHGGVKPGVDRIQLLESPVDGLGTRLKLFDAAARSLDIVCHTIHPGPSTDAFWDAVREAADRGVRVRIMLDGKASSVRPASVAIIKNLARHPRIAVRRYNPISLFKPWKWHYLMHDKFIVVDGTYLLLGGRNIGDKFFVPDDFTGKVSNDRDVLVWKQAGQGTGVATGSAVDQAAGYFLALWQSPEAVRLRPCHWRASKTAAFDAMLHAQALAFRRENPAYTATPLSEYLARTTPTRKITLIHNPIAARRKTPWIWQQLQRIALEADKSVVLQSPYITANSSILGAFTRIAARRHLSVLTNSAASTPNFPAFSNYFTQRLKFVQTGAHIFEYQSRHSIHGKAMVVDRRLGIVGSFNMDDRSMHLDTEIMLVVDCDDFAQTLLGAIGAYQAQSLRVGEDGAYSIPGEAVQATVPAYKVPLLRAVSLLSRPLRVFI